MARRKPYETININQTSAFQADANLDSSRSREIIERGKLLSSGRNPRPGEKTIATVGTAILQLAILAQQGRRQSATDDAANPQYKQEQERYSQTEKEVK
jgi:hypothetical protein